MSYYINKPEVEVDVKQVVKQIENSVVETNLAGYVKNQLDKAKRAKVEITERLLKCERQRRGVYDPDRAAEIQATGGSDIYMMITDVKCRAAESWIKDVLLTQNERFFDLTPSKEPMLPMEMKMGIIDLVKSEAEEYLTQGDGQLHPETFRARMEEVHETVMERLRQEAKDAARRMADKVDDQMHQGKFQQALRDTINDFVTYPGAIMKGPVVKRKKSLTWGPKFTPIVMTDLVRTFQRVSPFDIFPSAGSRGPDDGYIFQRHPLTRGSLEEMRGLPGVNEQAITDIVARYGRSGLQNFMQGDVEHRHLEGKTLNSVVDADHIEGWEFWGSVNGQWLIEWGMKDKFIKPEREYEVNLWMVEGIVFKTVINPDPLGRRPYDVTAFEEIPDSFWGKALPEIMRDTQVMCNAAARALANNMGIASGPQAEVTVDRLPDGEEISTMYPWKIWQTTSDRTGGGQPAIRFFQPNMNAPELLAVYQHFAKQADEVTGIPNYVYGSSSVSGAGRTASGLSMLMDNASKGIKQAISNIDRIISGTVHRLYLHNMMYDDDPYIKGDYNVVARGAIGLIHKEQLQIRRNEFLAATANPVDLQILGTQGRAALLRELARGLQMDVDKLVPNDESMESREIQTKAQAMAQQMLAQLQQAQPQQMQPMGMEAPQAATTVVPQMADGGYVKPMAEQVLESLALTNQG